MSTAETLAPGNKNAKMADRESPVDARMLRFSQCGDKVEACVCGTGNNDSIYTIVPGPPGFVQ